DYYYTLGSGLSNDGAKTGQLTKIVDNKNQNRNRAYAYDALGRLMSVSGGVDAPTNAPVWRQKYSYDRFGNRSGVAWDTNLTIPTTTPLDGFGSLGFTDGQNKPLTNRITTAGYPYDKAGNVPRGQDPNGAWQN